MDKPLLILDQHFRTVEELFSPRTLSALSDLCRIEGGENAPIEPARLERLLGEATFLVAARPEVNRERLAAAPNLKAIIEVSGAFHGEVDYKACFARGLEVLSCAPGFRFAVAEMGLSMLLAASRGLVDEHEAFRIGQERWLDDRPTTDFTLYGQKIGFVGYGNIARELHRLLMPFEPVVSAYDPWLKSFSDTVSVHSLSQLFRECRAVIVTAVPDTDNKGLVSAKLIDEMQAGAVLVLLSRAHVIDFNAAEAAAQDGRITFATDVFPSEPVAKDESFRATRQMVFSPHRAAAVPGGRQPIGDFILHDVSAILDGRPERKLLPADLARVEGLIQAQRDIESQGKLFNT